MAAKGKPRGRPFKKGNPGGPGRPPKPDLRTTIENLPPEIKDAIMRCQMTGRVVTVEEFASIALLCKCGEGDGSMIKYLNDHIHGKPKETVEIEETGRMLIVEEIVDSTDNPTA